MWGWCVAGWYPAVQKQCTFVSKSRAHWRVWGGKQAGRLEGGLAGWWEAGQALLLMCTQESIPAPATLTVALVELDSSARHPGNVEQFVVAGKQGTQEAGARGWVAKCWPEWHLMLTLASCYSASICSCHQVMQCNK